MHEYTWLDVVVNILAVATIVFAVVIKVDSQRRWRVTAQQPVGHLQKREARRQARELVRRRI
jgi:hypothetical protein